MKHHSFDDSFSRAMTEAAGTSQLLEGLVDKYAAMLGVSVKPDVELRDNLGSRWLGQTSWRASRPHTSVIALQRSIVPDPRTLERVVAHEMIHHRDFMRMPPSELALVKLGIKPAGHGASFRQGAQLINSIMGPGFVTETSDQEYAVAASGKEYVVLVTLLITGAGHRLGWSWASRLGPSARAWSEKKVGEGSRLVTTKDPQWLRGPKIEKYGGYAIPKTVEQAEALRKLYEGT